MTTCMLHHTIVFIVPQFSDSHIVLCACQRLRNQCVLELRTYVFVSLWWILLYLCDLTGLWVIWIPLYVLAVYHLYVCACVCGRGQEGEGALCVFVCLIIALCFSTYVPVVNITYLQCLCWCPKHIWGFSTDTSLYRVYAVGGAKSTCTVKSSTASLHGMYFSETQYASMLQRPVRYVAV